MYQCKHCNKIFIKGSSVGGHTIRCEKNPSRQSTIDKTKASSLGKKLSLEHKAKLSSTINKKIQFGTWHNSFARSRRHLYNGQLFDGMWEVHLARWFDSYSISWSRNKEGFPYFFGVARKYFPDFYLSDIDCYVEVKGWKTERDEAKWTQFPRRLIVLSGTDLQSLGLPISVRKDWK